MEKRRTPKQIAKIIVVILLALGFLAALTAFLLSPRTIIQDWWEIDLANIRVERVVNDSDYVDITDDIDLELLAQCLPLLQAGRLPEFSDSMPRAEQDYHLSIQCFGQHYHIELGRSGENAVYSLDTPNGMWYPILNADSFITLLDYLYENG